MSSDYHPRLLEKTPQQQSATGSAPPPYGAISGQVVTGAPGAAPPVLSPPRRAPPNNYLIWSIMTAICCSVPFGVIAVIFSLKSTTAYEAGNYQQALAAARTARTLNILGLAVGIVTFIVFIALSVVGAFV